ncbi:DNA-directed RNA polymerase subunit delta [Rummeliibacillus suwonensis]|uniref:DNA-directed RNA polymerase subunit delta n=1 Tax=Rummeliibacillus suwonensis TaxID=1306154 RepID=UPI0011B5D3E3
MHVLNPRDLTQEQLIEESLINLAYAILEENHKPMSFAEIIQAIIDLGARTSEEMKAASIQFYTDINIDGRFLVLGENRWGIREWYAIEQVEEETAPTVKVRKKKAKAPIVDEDVVAEDDDDIIFDEDFDEFVDDDGDEENDEEEDFDSADIEDIDDNDLDEDIEIDDEDFDIEEDLDEEDELEEDKEK